tara:strand:- start:12478 stop:13095 length:618 start_codon:yes stop_codon:yes gene_type:complete
MKNKTKHKWSGFLNELAMKSELPDGWVVIVTKDSNNFDDTFQILLARQETREVKNKLTIPEGGFVKIPGKDQTSSQVIITKYLEDPDCSDMYVLASASAPQGLGPLLYDIALELAGKSGIIPDRIYVSKDAYKVWDHYLNKREDVQKRQLTAEECPPADFFTDDEFDSDVWKKSPLSKVYYKPDDSNIKRLTKAGKMIYRTGDLL